MIKSRNISFFKKLKQFLINKLMNFFRLIFEFFRIEILSKPYGVEKIEYHNNLLKYIDDKNGFFVELGGYDGLFHSPTYYLEKFKQWKGILVEPHPIMYDKCVKNRSKSRVYNYACSTMDTIDCMVELNSIGHSSYIKNSLESDNFLDEMLDGISQKQNLYSVKCTSLTKILDHYFFEHPKQCIDLLVLDVEGHELEVLRGLDFSMYEPKAILCESHTNEEKVNIEKYLFNKGYEFIYKISSQDYLYKKTL